MKVFRDSVHDIISFDKHSEKLFVDLINTSEFQRLRHICQLGLSLFTYTGAEHTRLAHSLGVAHLMKRFVSRISMLKQKVTGLYRRRKASCRHACSVWLAKIENCFSNYQNYAIINI